MIDAWRCFSCGRLAYIAKHYSLGGTKSSPTSFFPETSKNLETSPQNILIFSFNTFATLV